MKLPQNILVFRTDRLGDVLMCLPALGMLRETFPEAELGFVCRKDHHPVLKGLLDSWGVALFSPENYSQLEAFQKHQPDAVLFLQAEREVVYAAFRAGVSTRVGLRSKWWSFLFLTHGLRQKRSRSEKNEAEYNLDLAGELARLSKREPRAKPPITLPLQAESKAKAELALKKVEIDVSLPFLVLHPGMGGSALNLSASHYAEIVKKLSAVFPVVVTIGPAPGDQDLKNLLHSQIPFLKTVENIEIGTLAEIFRLASRVIAPSTGPLHLAHYVGASTLGLFSPVRTHHPARWGPFGGTGDSVSLLPRVFCPATVACRGPRCPQYACMEQTDWAQLILEAVGTGASVDFNG